MIVVDLVCDQKHRFEGWFASSDALDGQKENGQLRCPVCDSQKVERMPSAPHLRRSTDLNPAAAQEATEAQQFLRALVERLKEHAAGMEDVGEAFTVEVRRIHEGESEERSIRGVATIEDVESLLEDGIGVLPLPVTKEDLH